MSRIFFQQLYQSDVRMLACRREPDPTVAGCCKQKVYAKGKTFFLCPARLDAFEEVHPAGDPVSLFGVECVI